MTLYGSLIVNSKDTYAEHYCQTRASLPPGILITAFPMNAFWNFENLEDVIFVWFFIYREFWRGQCTWIVYIQNHFTFSVIIVYYLTLL
jgi:hypothetical protein